MASIPKITVPIVVYAMIVVSFAGYDRAEASLGMNWGRESAQRLVPSYVVDLLLQNGIGRARLYTSQIDILAAFSGSGINVTCTVSNPQKVGSKEAARKWVKDRKDYFLPSNIKYFVFGEYVFQKGLTNKDYLFSAFGSLHLLQEALDEYGFGHVKVTFLNSDAELKPNATRPSECEFRDEIKTEMTDYLSILNESGAPFWIEHIPIMENAAQGFHEEFAFPDNTAHVVKDVGGAVYTNIVEWRYDCFVWAMKKLNASIPTISFSQVGWPTDGYPGATAANAERFYKHLLPWVTSNKGTPMRPGMPIDVNIHALADETKMNPQPYSRHWGIYRSNGAPKYKIDLSGQGRDVYPNTIVGMMRMPNRWCVFNGDIHDMEKVRKEVESACSESDCTSTLPGGTCSGLTFEQNVSYALNMRFQFTFQNESACNATSFGHVVVDNPSTEQCVFPVEVVKGQQQNYVKPSLWKDPPSEGFHRSRPAFALFVVWLSILLGEILLLV